MKFNDTWNLEAIFPGGTKSPHLQEKITEINHDITLYSQTLSSWSDDSNLIELFSQLLDLEEKIVRGIGQTRNFVTMYQSAYMDDEYAGVVMGQITDLVVKMEKESNRFLKNIVHISDSEWKQIITNERFQSIAFRLEEMRTEGKRLRTEVEEEIIAELKKDGITAWSQLYDKTVALMTIPFTDENGETTQLSIGQAMNRMYADPNHEVRKQLFEQWENAWQHYGPVFAHTLNHLIGFRLTLQNLEGRKHHLDEPLEFNRMSEETLQAMWQAIEDHKQPFLDYLDKKAHLLGMERLEWQDVDAPVTVGEREPVTFSYEEACDFVLEHFATFGEKLTSFTKHALTNRWIEAED